MNFKLGEFFCGPGGIALGAILSGKVLSNKGEEFRITPEWASDYDENTCKTYAYNIHNENLDSSSHVILADIKDVEISTLKKCDGFAFGFPCNDFSIVGETKGLEGKFGPLYSYGVEYLKQHQPLWFVAENVSGLSSSNEGKAFELILNSLRNTGYKITPNLYKFEEYGVPQSRHRIIIVGIRNDLDIEFRVPLATTKDNPKSCWDAISIPPIQIDVPNQEITKQSNTVIERLKHIAPGGNAWSESIPHELRLNVKGARLSNIYKRLDPKKPAYTVTGSGGGGTHMYHWSENRALTNRERARLQTFPDNYVFIGSKESVRKQIGMAVPPEGIKIIFRAILDTFAGNKYPSTEPNIKF